MLKFNNILKQKHSIDIKNIKFIFKEEHQTLFKYDKPKIFFQKCLLVKNDLIIWIQMKIFDEKLFEKTFSEKNILKFGQTFSYQKFES